MRQNHALKNYNRYNLLNETKCVKIIGKEERTPFIKHHSYQKQLSQKKVPEKDIQTIGIYQKPNTPLTKLITEKRLGKKWKSAFNTYIALTLLTEFCSIIDLFVKSNYEDKKMKEAIQSLTLPQYFTEELLPNEQILLTELKKVVLTSKIDFQNWLKEPKENTPLHLDGKSPVEFLIHILRDNGFFKNTTFHVFFDNFDGFDKEQQKIINTWLKHGRDPLLFSVAHEKNAKVTNETTGKEWLERRNDFRVIDLDAGEVM